jgi:hypothetical protein
MTFEQYIKQTYGHLPKELQQAWRSIEQHDPKWNKDNPPSKPKTTNQGRANMVSKTNRNTN